MRILKFIWILLQWFVYVAMTQDERLRYSMGKRRGKHCSRRQEVGWLPGSDVIYTFENRPPEREYLTIKEFFDLTPPTRTQN